jgi:hypothetical protein
MYEFAHLFMHDVDTFIGTTVSGLLILGISIGAFVSLRSSDV